MGRQVLRRALAALDAFTALTAVAGSVLLVTGREAERFPVEALRRTPFRDYVMPGYLLGSLVGGQCRCGDHRDAAQPARGRAGVGVGWDAAPGMGVRWGAGPRPPGEDDDRPR